MHRLVRLAPLLALLAPLAATETENLALRVLPAGGTVQIDGDPREWDLAGGIFGCGDVENQRGRYAFWAHAAWDADNLYLLVRFVDPTPLNNPGQVEGDYGFAGDSLQFRAIVGAGGDPEKGRTSHWTCWRGRDGKHVMDLQYGIKFDQGSLKDAQAKGAKQAFAVDADRQGYCQEIAVPWSLIAPAGWKPAPDERIRLTFEPNFTVGLAGRLSVKDLFAADRQPDRVFTFMSNASWGAATLAGPGKVEPAPVRLADRREFPVRVQDGRPTIDWNGLIVQRDLPGHKAIAFDMPFDGYISLNLFAADGSVARQLLNGAFYGKGHHEVKWDGLGTFSWREPGEPVPAGTYSWRALVHPGLDLKLVGWAANAGSAPWDGPGGKDNWGGDEGDPISAACAGDTVLLGWSFAEAGKALLACDRDAHVKWKNSRQGMSGCTALATDGGFVYAVNQKYAYRLALADGAYAAWPGRDSPDLHPHDLLDEAQRKAIPDQVDAIAARDGELFLAVTAGNAVLVVDGRSGSLKRVIALPAPVALAAPGGGVLYASSGHAGIVAIDLASGQAKPFATLADVWGLACGPGGEVYAALRGSRQQVAVLDAAGHEQRTIGRPGGRPATGPWDPSGLREPAGIAVDGAGRLWVAEQHASPKRVSVWDTRSGAFVRELFGPSAYGALGGSISPKDPLTMAGLGCEWRLDPASGRAACVGVIDDGGFQNSRFATGANGREYLLTAGNWAFDLAPLKVWERTAPGAWKLRAMLMYRDAAGKDLAKAEQLPPGVTTQLWADRNGDGRQDPDELGPKVPGMIRVSGWYMMAAPDLTLYAGDGQYRCSGFTACGAPTWDLAAPVRMPAPGLGSADGRLVLQNGAYGEAHARFRCLDIASGKQRWWYPDNFVGVHGSHNAPPAEPGMIRGAYEACATVRLPPPIGNAWIIPTNVGEWHILTEQGFYLARLFQPDQLKVVFPEQAVPGALLNDAPCGMGGEDFGGSATVAADGRLYVQAGKTGFWNVEVADLDKVRELAGGSVTIAEADLALARGFREQAQQAAAGKQRLMVHRATPAFTGDLAKDFAGAAIAAFDKGAGTRVRTAVAWDEGHLHIGWEVQDRTPWVNGARSPDAMYWGGDTVDLQLGTDPAAAADRSEAVAGDLRLSLGACAGKDAAVLFRPVSAQKHPMTFSSGVVKAYTMDSVTVLERAVIAVHRRADGYTVEASIPVADLGIAPKAGLVLRGDLGATFGNQAGDRTRLRSYWSSRHTGIVDDVVFELKLEPRYWGEIVLAE